MKNLSKRKPVNMQKKQAHRASANHQTFQMLVISLNETREEEHLVRMLKY
jgi:hypothetical protein